MEYYEYKVEHLRFMTEDHLGEATKFLHKMSEQGWRLASLDIKEQLQKNYESLKVVLMQKKESAD